MVSKTTFNAVGPIMKMAPDFQPDTCRWIEGHGANKHFPCAEPAIRGGSYCPEHHKRCYVKPPEPKNELTEPRTSVRFPW